MDNVYPEDSANEALKEFPASNSIVGYVKNFLRYVVEVPAAVLVLLETIVLLTSVIARYVFHSPLTWIDELASALFLWLAMLGTVVAFQRGEHMRLTSFVEIMPAPVQRFAETISTCVSLLFMGMILVPAYDYFQDESFVTTPAMGMPNSWRVVALFVGMVLLIASSLVRLCERAGLKTLLLAIVVLLGITASLYVATPMLKSIGNYNLIVFFVVLVAVSVFMGVPIAFAFGIASVAYLTCVTTVPLSVAVSRMDEGMSHVILLSVPLFVFLGSLIVMTGMAEAMVRVLSALLGHFRGGLSYVLLGAMYLVSGISGSKAADMAAVAPVLFPEMRRRGAKPGELVALLSASGAMSETIPPSLVLITIGSVTGVSISALFTAGLFPAFVLALVLGIVAFLRTPREDTPVPRPPVKEILKLFAIALPAIALPFLIRAAVVEGVATATEVSTLGIAYAVIVGIFVYRKFDLRKLYPMLLNTASLSGAILIIIGTATAMGWALTQSGFSAELAHVMGSVYGGKIGFILISVVAFAFLGSVLEGIPAVVLFAPLLFPIAKSLGVNEVHYAIVVVLSMGLGLFAPPFGVGYYIACAIGKVDPREGLKAIWVYMGALLLAVLIIALVPWFTTAFL